MDTREIAKEYRITHWAQILQERRASGKSIRAYCHEADICENVYYWQRRMREVAYKQLSMQTPGSEQREQLSQRFAELRVTEPEKASEEFLAGTLQIEVGGMRINADSAYPLEQLAALLRALSQPC